MPLLRLIEGMFSNLLRERPSELPAPGGMGPRFWLLPRLGRGAPEDPLRGRVVDMIEEDLTLWQDDARKAAFWISHQSRN